MNKTNPLYILLLFIVLFIVSIIKYNQNNTKLQEITLQYNQANQLAKQYNENNKIWNNKNISSDIKKLAKSLNISTIQITTKNKITTIRISSLSTYLINKFINKLLNKKWNINKLKITNNFIMVQISRL